MSEPAESTRPSVAFVGNVANVGLRTVRVLRGCGIDAHLYVNQADSALSGVENEDPALWDSPPPWIHDEKWISIASLLFPSRSRLARELRSYDLVIATGVGPVWAQFAKRPWFFFVTGGDLTVRPFPITYWHTFPTLPHRLASLVAGAWQRRAARHATELWVQPFAPVQSAADRLSVPRGKRNPRYFPLVIDTELFDPARRTAEDAWAEDLVATSDFVVFHPSRMVMERSSRMVRAGQWKGNDVLLRGFAAFAGTRTTRDPLLLIPAIDDSHDLAMARKLVHELGIEDRVRWIKPTRGRVLYRDQMVALYRAADVVADEFGVGWFGNVSLEGLAMATPVVTHLDEAIMGRLYPEGHPMVEARDPRDVTSALVALAEDPVRRRESGRRSREWILDHHSPSAVEATYIEALTQVFSDQSSRASDTPPQAS